MKYVLCINGPPRSGKDTAANFLETWPGAHLMRFSDPLKDAVCAMFGITREEAEKDKDVPQDRLMGLSYRQWQISMSEEWIKPLYGKDWFGKHLARRILTTNTEERIIVVPDSGFQPELDALCHTLPQSEFTVGLLRITRLGTDFSSDSRGYVEPNSRCIYLNQLANDGSFTTFCHAVRGRVIREWIKPKNLLLRED